MTTRTLLCPIHENDRALISAIWDRHIIQNDLRDMPEDLLTFSQNIYLAMLEDVLTTMLTTFDSADLERGEMMLYDTIDNHWLDTEPSWIERNIIRSQHPICVDISEDLLASTDEEEWDMLLCQGLGRHVSTLIPTGDTTKELLDRLASDCESHTVRLDCEVDYVFFTDGFRSMRLEVSL